jgi:hypothetical protein
MPRRIFLTILIGQYLIRLKLHFFVPSRSHKRPTQGAKAEETGSQVLLSSEGELVDEEGHGKTDATEPRRPEKMVPRHTHRQFCHTRFYCKLSHSTDQTVVISSMILPSARGLMDLKYKRSAR